MTNHLKPLYDLVEEWKKKEDDRYCEDFAGMAYLECVDDLSKALADITQAGECGTCKGVGEIWLGGPDNREATKCPECEGTGTPVMIKCGNPDCKNGEVRDSDKEGNWFLKPCPDCQGQAKLGEGELISKLGADFRGLWRSVMYGKKGREEGWACTFLFGTELIETDYFNSAIEALQDALQRQVAGHLAPKASGKVEVDQDEISRLKNEFEAENVGRDLVGKDWFFNKYLPPDTGQPEGGE